MVDNEDEYEYEFLSNERDARLCGQLISEELTRCHPLTICDNLTSEQFFTQHCWPILSVLYNEGLSILARDKLSGEIIGSIIAGDLCLFREYLLNKKINLGKSFPINDLHEELNRIFLEKEFNQQLKPNLVLHIHLVAVKSLFTGQGIATKLHQRIVDKAIHQNGFEYAFVTVTNPILRYIYLNQMNGKELTTIDPTTWRWKTNTQRLSYPYLKFHHDFIHNIIIHLREDLQD